MSTNGKRNRNAGHAFELHTVKKLKEHGFEHVGTTRNLSTKRDSQKVDIMNEDEDVHGRLPYNVQTKSSTRGIAYPKVLSEMPDDNNINVVFHRQTARRGESGRFMTRGEYALLNLDDFYQMMEKIEAARKLLPHLDSLFDYYEDEDQEEIEELIKKIK